MMLLNLDTPNERLIITRFPDSQPHVNVPALTDPGTAGEPVDVLCSITSPEKLLMLLQVSNAIERHGRRKGILRIPYLLGARYDRLMRPGDSLDLEVIANLINSADFAGVTLFDVHSDVATALIRRSRNINNECVVRAASGPTEVVLILPDSGAAKKADHYRDWSPAITDVVQCRKSRDAMSGRISLVVPDPDLCRGRSCLIVDDLCDGGATFLSIAQQIKCRDITLAVSHGIFSKGLNPFAGWFDRIITTTSYPSEAVRTPAPPGIHLVVIPHPL